MQIIVLDTQQHISCPLQVLDDTNISNSIC